MEELSTENQKKNKYSLVTGEKIKTKKIRKLKKEHKKQDKLDKIEEKKFNKRKKKVDKKLNKNNAITVEAKTVSNNGLVLNDEVNKVNLETVDNINVQKVKEQGREVLIVRKSERGKPKTLRSKVRNLLSYVLVGFVAIFFGYLAGNFYVANVLNNVDYSAFSEDVLRDDAKVVYETIIASGKSLDKVSAGELFVASEYVLNNQDNYYATTVGAIQPSIGSKQDIWGYKKKTGNIYECESASKGMLSLAEKYYYDIEAKSAQIYKASKISSGSTTYPENATWNMTYDEYKEEYGTSPDAPCVPYIISSQTIVEGTEAVTSMGGGKYKISFSLTNDSSVINYVKQVKHMSGLESYPTFKVINVTAIIDSDMKFTYIRYDEAYTVMYFGVMATCSGYVENNFTY